MVNGVRREVLRPKPKGAAGSKVFGRGTSQGFSFTMIHTPKTFPQIFILSSSWTSKEGFLALQALRTVQATVGGFL